MNVLPLKQPSPLVPIAMSLAVLAMTLDYLAIVGVAAAHKSDEGVAAYVFQLPVAEQVPVVVFFSIKWLPRAPRQHAAVLALQVDAALAAFAPSIWSGCNAWRRSHTVRHPTTASPTINGEVASYHFPARWLGDSGWPPRELLSRGAPDRRDAPDERYGPRALSLPQQRSRLKLTPCEPERFMCRNLRALDERA